jgi:hydrogenase/urease accessory protein HupE
MSQMNNTIIALASLLTAVVLILHHGYKHRSGGQDPLYGVDQYFQLSDVGNFRTFNHEMFVIFFTVIGFGLLFYRRFSL